jgi:hypothetical protein
VWSTTGSPTTGSLTLDVVLGLVLSILGVNDTLDDLKVQLTFTFGLTCDHVLLELFRFLLLPGMSIHVGHDRALEVVVYFAPTLV